MPTRSILQPFQTASAVETRHFLATHSTVDDELMRELWNVSSGLPGLLDARRLETVPRPLRRGEKDFTYSLVSSKYRRTTGRAVSEREIRSAIFKVSNEAKNRARQITKQMIAGTILFVIWYQQMRSLMKALYRAVWLVSLGGALFEDDQSRAAFYLWILWLFDRIDGLKNAIETGRIPFNGRILNPVGTMARGANGAFQNAKLQTGKRRGHNQARRILGENENHCHEGADRPGCIELTALNWVHIDAIVPIGNAQCFDNCLCQIITRKRPND